MISRNIFEKSKLYPHLALHRLLFKKDHKSTIVPPKFSIREDMKSIAIPAPVPLETSLIPEPKPYILPAPTFVYEVLVNYNRVKMFKAFPIEDLRVFLKTSSLNIKFQKIENHSIQIIATHNDIEIIKEEMEKINKLLEVKVSFGYDNQTGKVYYF